MHSGKKPQSILVKVMISRIRTPFYIFFLNPVYVAARWLHSLRSNYSNQYINDCTAKAMMHILCGKTTPQDT